MKKNTAQLVVIISLICCTIALLTCGILVACKDMGGDTPKTPSTSIEDDDEWTNNY